MEKQEKVGFHPFLRENNSALVIRHRQSGQYFPVTGGPSGHFYLKLEKQRKFSPVLLDKISKKEYSTGVPLYLEAIPNYTPPFFAPRRTDRRLPKAVVA